MQDKTSWQKDTDGSWYITAFHRDTNVHHHHIGIEKTHKAKVYKVYIESGKYGEELWSKDCNGLANAKNVAINTAIELACYGELKC